MEPTPPINFSVTVNPTLEPVDADARHETVEDPIGIFTPVPVPVTPVAVLEGLTVATCTEAT